MARGRACGDLQGTGSEARGAAIDVLNVPGIKSSDADGPALKVDPTPFDPRGR